MKAKRFVVLSCRSDDPSAVYAIAAVRRTENDAYGDYSMLRMTGHDVVLCPVAGVSDFRTLRDQVCCS